MNFFYKLGYLISRIKFEYARGARDGFAPDYRDKEAKILNVIQANPSGNYIEAIRTHRTIYGTSLKDAKDAVDALYTKHGIVR